MGGSLWEQSVMFSSLIPQKVAENGFVVVSRAPLSVGGKIKTVTLKSENCEIN